MDSKVLCIDLGGTKLSLAHVCNGDITNQQTYKVPSLVSLPEFNQFLFNAITPFVTNDVNGISIGVPSLIEMSSGKVVETVNIPAWQNVEIKSLLESQFKIPVIVNNDANCFAVGEYHYGSGKQCNSIIGVCMGTGLGAGLILNGKLYTGNYSAAGEFGSFPYLDATIEDYCSGKLFTNYFNTSGVQAYTKANEGCDNTMQIFKQLGCHIGAALHQVILSFDPDKVVLGGSVSQSFKLFNKSMMQTLKGLTHPILFKNIQVEQSQLEHAALLGAYKIFIDEK